MDRKVSRKRFSLKPPPPPPPAVTIPSYLDLTQLMADYTDCATANTLFQALHAKMKSYVSEETLKGVFEEYMVLSTRRAPHSPVFLQIDREYNCRTGKVMGYDSTAHRNGQIVWIHKNKGVDPHFRLVQTLFGAHLVAEAPVREMGLAPRPDNPRVHTLQRVEGLHQGMIWLFESEKTALIVRAIVKEMGEDWIVPMACGGCGGLNPSDSNLANPHHALHALRYHRVFLCPDQGKYTEWQSRIESLSPFCYDVQISTLMEHPERIARYAPTYTPRPGDDLADLLLHILSSTPADLLPQRLVDTILHA